MFLTQDELRELTARRMPSAQARVLKAMSIAHKVRPDGTIAVLRAHVNATFGAGAGASIVRSSEPDWSAVA